MKEVEKYYDETAEAEWERLSRHRARKREGKNGEDMSLFGKACGSAGHSR